MALGLSGSCTNTTAMSRIVLVTKVWMSRLWVLGFGICFASEVVNMFCFPFRFRFVLPTGFLQLSTAPCTASSPVGQRAMTGGNDDPV